MVDDEMVIPQVGVHATVTDYSMPLLDLALETEGRGLRSLWFAEHSHIPVGSDQDPLGGPMPTQYKHLLDAFISAAWVTASTSLEVGTGVSLVAEHDAISLAKAVATLDYLSEGRVLLGMGFGYNRAEAADHGFPATERAVRAEETVALMRALWTEEEAAYEGSHLRLSPSWAWPKPHRPHGPPVLLGAPLTDRNLARIVSWTDGWIPMRDRLDYPALAEDSARLHQAWQAAGREPAGPAIIPFFQPAPADSVAQEVEQASRLGIRRMLVFIEDRSRDAVLPLLDEVAEGVRRFLG